MGEAARKSPLCPEPSVDSSHDFEFGGGFFPPGRVARHSADPARGVGVADDRPECAGVCSSSTYLERLMLTGILAVLIALFGILLA